jgi:hypothetical protein
MGWEWSGEAFGAAHNAGQGKLVIIRDGGSAGPSQSAETDNSQL